MTSNVQNNKYYSSLKISLVYLVISSLYIIISDKFILQIFSRPLSVEMLTTIGTYKGLVFVLTTSVILFVLIQREIKVKRKSILDLELQKQDLINLTTENEKVKRSLQDRNIYIETILKKVIESEAKFSTLFKLNPTAIVFTRLSDGVIMEVNQAYIDLFGYSEAELINQSTKKISIWEEVTQRDIMVGKLTQKGFIHNYEARAVRKNGEVIDTLSYLQIIDYSGEKSIIAIILDVTEKKRNELQIKESRLLLEKIVNNLNEAVLLIEPGGRYIQMANTAAEKIFGYTQQEIIGKQTELLHVNQQMFKEFAKESEPELGKNGIFHTEFKMKHKNGSIIDTENTVSAILEADGWKQGVVSVIRDITERKISEIKLKEYQDSLKQLTIEISLTEEKQRKEIAANIHDHLSQLLVISRMKLKDLINDTSNADVANELKTVIQFISEALENTRKITYDLSPPVLYEFGLVETLYWLAEKTQAEHHIKTLFTTGLNEIELSEMKLILIFRIIQELVNNTVKHAQANNLKIEMNTIDNVLEIIVSDDGVGFKVNALPKVKVGGGGFGLFAVKERVQNLAGSISLYSEKNKGTTVKINVPLINY